MFTTTPDLTELRQGDILRGMYYPEPAASDLVLEGKANEPLDQTLTATVQYETDAKKLKWIFGRIRYLLRGYSMVITQCCDLEARIGGLPKSTSIVLAPVLDIAASVSRNPDHLEKLKLNDVREFTNFFYVPACSPALSSESMVNLNRLFSISREGFSFLLSRKILQMTVEARFQLKNKLQYNFSRPAGDDDHLYPDPALPQDQAGAADTQ